MELKESIECAVQKCIKEGVLKEFLECHESEVVDMLFTEFCLDDALEVRRQEGWESGFEEGKKIGKKEIKFQIATNLLGFMDDKTIAKNTGLSIKEVEELRKPLA